MPQIITGQRGARSHYPIAEALWLLAGAVLLLAFGDEVILVGLALAVAAMAAIWWIHRHVERRAHGGDVRLAAVTVLGRDRADPAAGHTLWRGPRAA